MKKNQVKNEKRKGDKDSVRDAKVLSYRVKSSKRGAGLSHYVEK